MWIHILVCLGLATVKKSIPILHTSHQPKLTPDLQTVEAIITNRYTLAVKYTKLLKAECLNEGF